MKSSIQTASADLSTDQTDPMPPPPVELLTQVEMAQRLGINRRTLHAWVLSGAVPMIKIRGFCRFEPAKVWAALLQHEVQAGSKSTVSREDARAAETASTAGTHVA